MRGEPEPKPQMLCASVLSLQYYFVSRNGRFRPKKGRAEGPRGLVQVSLKVVKILRQYKRVMEKKEVSLVAGDCIYLVQFVVR